MMCAPSCIKMLTDKC